MVDLDQVKENVVNSQSLVFAEKQDSKNPGEEKYNGYFASSKNVSHRYVLTVNGKVIIVTIIKINRDWQRMLEKK